MNVRREPEAEADRVIGDAAPAVGAPVPSPAEVAADDPVRLHASSWVRGLLMAAGVLCVALGVVGIFVPLLPTTPFMLLAAACFARGSRRFHDALLAHPTLGPMIREWRRDRSIPYRTKLTAIGLMSGTLALSIVFLVRPLWLQLLLAACGLALALWMYRIPSRDRA